MVDFGGCRIQNSMRVHSPTFLTSAARGHWHWALGTGHLAIWRNLALSLPCFGKQNTNGGTRSTTRLHPYRVGSSLILPEPAAPTGCGLLLVGASIAQVGIGHFGPLKSSWSSCCGTGTDPGPIVTLRTTATAAATHASSTYHSHSHRVLLHSSTCLLSRSLSAPLV